MLVSKYENVLLYDVAKARHGHKRIQLLEKIKFRQFQKSEKTMEKIRKAGLDRYIGNNVVVEAKYAIKSLIGYGATSAVYKAEQIEKPTGSPQAADSDKICFTPPETEEDD